MHMQGRDFSGAPAPRKSNEVMTTAERFDAKWMLEPGGSCWLWTASQVRGGYGRFNVGGGRLVLAHWFAYERAKGSIPEGLDLDHLCRERLCVNPDHLEPVTRRENVRRGEGVGLAESRVTHCPQGHAYTPENIYHDRKRNGRYGRKCRTCALERARRRTPSSSF